MALVQEQPAVDVTRWSGVSLMLGGILFAVHLFTHPAGETAKYAFEPLWVPSHVIGAVALVLIALGLMGFYARQARQLGWFGLLAVVLTFVGCTLTAGSLIFASAMLVPFLATRGLDWVDPPSGALYTLPAFQIAVGVGGVALLVGLLLVAIATLRAHVIPPLGAWLVILNTPLSVVAVVLVLFVGTSQQGLFQAIAGAVGGLGVAAWGWALWSHEGAAARAVR